MPRKFKSSSTSMLGRRGNTHPRNKYAENPPDFDILASLYPSFHPYVFYAPNGRPRIDWTDYNATRELTRVLLHHDYAINWWIPDGQLCPTVPNRLNYIHWIEDLLASELIPKQHNGDRVRGFDIGTGANCIYPLLGAALHRWHFVGTDVWWTSYGGKAPHLQKLAIRVVSQTCSSSGCERNWSEFDKIHSEKCNRLEFQRLNDMVYIYYNLRLWVKQLEKTPDVEAISLDNIDTIAAWRVDNEWPTMDTFPDLLDVDPKALAAEEVAIAGEGEPEVEEEEQGQEAEQEEDEEEEVTPSSMDNNRGQRPPLLLASRGSLSPFVSPGAGPSSSRGKVKAITYSRKRGRGSQ